MAKKLTFVCQILDETLKIVKYSHKKPLSVHLQNLSSKGDHQIVIKQLCEVLKNLGYKNQQLIVSLPRNLSTLNFLRLPSSIPSEIENMIALQAPSFLLYQPTELTLGYDIVTTDKDGYSNIVVISLHKNIVENYINNLVVPLEKIKFVLSSYGIVYLYQYLYKKSSDTTTLLIEIDKAQIELAIVHKNKFLFSRSVKMNLQQNKWQDFFITEIDKTINTYTKETKYESPKEIVLCGAEKFLPVYEDVLKKLYANLNVIYSKDITVFGQKLQLPSEYLEYSFFSLLGLIVAEIQDSLNLLPASYKSRIKSVAKKNRLVKLIAFNILTVLLFTMGLFLDLRNKKNYIKNLEAQINTLAKDVKPLEEFVDRLNFLAEKLKTKTKYLEMINAIFQTIPEGISLSNFEAEENKKIILNGLSENFDILFSFVSDLEKLDLFKNYTIKIQYAVARKFQNKEIVDFEILLTANK